MPAPPTDTLTDTAVSPPARVSPVSEASAQRVPVVDYLVLQGEPHLVAQACTSCGALFFDRRNACARCGKRDFERKALATTGKLRSFTIVHRAAPNVPVPYVSSVVELDGGGVVKANIVDAGSEAEKFELGMALRLTTFPCGRDEEGTEAVAFGFTPA
jgi:uncharacterized OB-fold protein